MDLSNYNLHNIISSAENQYDDDSDSEAAGEGDSEGEEPEVDDAADSEDGELFADDDSVDY